jgi:hypothetical protein
MRNIYPQDGELAGTKAHLVCDLCSHESPIYGDWRITEDEHDGERKRIYECPDCCHTLVVQPVFEEDSAVLA